LTVVGGFLETKITQTNEKDKDRDHYKDKTKSKTETTTRTRKRTKTRQGIFLRAKKYRFTPWIPRTSILKALGTGRKGERKKKGMERERKRKERKEKGRRKKLFYKY
jgi:hypothetical protein